MSVPLNFAKFFKNNFFINQKTYSKDVLKEADFRNLSLKFQDFGTKNFVDANHRVFIRL